MKIFLILYLILVCIMSLVAFVAYGMDKRWAKLEKRRISEQSLHMIAFFGGWPGALLGQRVFRHKTQKLSFRIVFWALLTLHLAIVVGVVYFLIDG